MEKSTTTENGSSPVSHFITVVKKEGITFLLKSAEKIVLQKIIAYQSFMTSVKNVSANCVLYKRKVFFNVKNTFTFKEHGNLFAYQAYIYTYFSVHPTPLRIGWSRFS